MAGDSGAIEAGAVAAPSGVTWQRVRWVVGALLVAKLGALALSLSGTAPGTATVALAEESAAVASAPNLAVIKPPGAEPANAAGRGAGAAAREHAGSGAGGDVKSLLESLSRRQTELDTREKTLAAREEKLALYEKDVTAKIVQLEKVGKALKEEMRSTAGASDEAAQSLAKVYGAMKPAEAAPILDQLDEATALRILTRMKEKQVGEILPFMKRDRAVVLTRSLAGRVVAPATPPKG